MSKQPKGNQDLGPSEKSQSKPEEHETDPLEMLPSLDDGCYWCRMADPEFRRQMEERGKEIMKGLEEWGRVSDAIEAAEAQDAKGHNGRPHTQSLRNTSEGIEDSEGNLLWIYDTGVPRHRGEI